ncbi:hypothetical protein [Shewanella aestuarii]|uniref:DUF4124 domain-containing protein n=1 Tax=Shewanella aestuarii TaxID=1028752 RepID=A0A6G9QL31_9GAMM|nr:hypothetical protein [Shewanella aestuarii]QIR14833.1 hypothetical protein HBH39_10310 [Shewanella aestuarii]
MDGKSWFIFVLCLMAFNASAQVYKCADGKYQSDPCDEQSQPLDLSNVGNIVESPVKALQYNDETQSAATTKAEVTDYIRKQQIKREITTLENDRKKVFAARDDKIAQLRNRGRHANNNLAGATWQQSLAQEMTAVMQQADTDVQTIDRQIESLKSQLLQQ